jgi:shikimate dehydrogenase
MEVLVATSACQLTVKTGLLGVIGCPVEHSLSPLIHNAALRADGIDMVYLAFKVEPTRLEAALKGVRALGIRGINVTVPHKETILGLLDNLDPLATRVGAVNTVVNEGDRLVGYNTDVTGFLGALETVAPGKTSGGRFLIAGAGGAARAVIAGLCQEGAAEVWIYNRTEGRAESLCEASREWGSTRCNVARLGALPELAAGVDVLVNASSVGLGDTVKLAPFPVDIVSGRHVVIDLVYGLNQTALVSLAQTKGAVAIDGREMLVRQAASSYRLWTGREAPMEVMRVAIESVGS